MGIVTQIIDSDCDMSEVIIEIDYEKRKAVNYNAITGTVKVGDRVLVNTSAVFLQLGTGGYDFIMHNYNNTCHEFTHDKGHIMKLRYTPIQLKCLTVEEPGSQYHKLICEKDSIDGLCVLIGSLHSMLSPAIHILKYYNKQLKIAYIMTDSACLPIAFSKTVRRQKKCGNLHATITCGQAFGGDYEAVNIYTALLTAKYVCKSDIVIITPGPGVVGTSTKLGFSGIEQGSIIDAVNNLNGLPVFIPRISFADQRKRHYGISHHSITVLSKIAYSSAYIGIPIFNTQEKNDFILRQIENHELNKKHYIRYINDSVLDIMEHNNIEFNTMGRGLEQDPDFFQTIGSAVTFCLNNYLS